MGPADALAAWRERAEAELRGQPLGSLTTRRVDGLVIPPLEVANPLREEGLASGPAKRSIALVVDERSVEVARPFFEAVDVLWIRGQRGPDAPAPTVVIEPSERDFDRTAIGGARVLSDPAIEVVRGGSARPWDARDAISSAALHDLGASPVTQVALMVAAMLERRRALGSARPPAFAAAVSPEIFVELSKLRAARRLSDRVLATLGEPLGAPLFVRTDARSQARLDRATNAVRSALGVAAAMLGGADCVGAAAMDAVGDDPSALGLRLARNTSLVLSLESSLTATDDPARGSYSVESLTDRIAREAWEVVREIERRGGLAAAASWASERIESEATARRAAVRTRAIPMVGVSRFAMAGDEVRGVDTIARDASPFEALHVGEPPPVQLLVLGARSAVEARAAYARELIEAGGMRVIAPDDGSSAHVTLIAAPDALFATEVLSHVRALHEKGVDVWIAGRPLAHEAALRGAGARGFVFVGADIVDVLSAMRARATRPS